MKVIGSQLCTAIAAFAFSSFPALAMFNNLISTSGLDPNQQQTVAPINSTIPFEGIVPPLAASIEALPAAEQAFALDQLSPEKFGYFTSTQAFNNATFEVLAVDAYLASMRQGTNGTFASNGGFDSSGLTVSDADVDPALSMIHSKMLAWNPDRPPAGVLSDIAANELGGTDMVDDKDSGSSNSATYENPWHSFVRGNVILASGPSNQDISHFDYRTSSVVLGTDYRVSPHFLVGLTASYSHTDATLDNQGSSATVDSLSPGLYASYADGGWYANLVGDYIHNVYTQDRVVSFLGQTANSATDGNEGIANLDGGYDFHHGALKYGPLLGLQYTHLSVDGYNESGSLADLSVNQQQADSLRSRFGGEVSYLFNDGGISITPRFSASYQHEFMDKGRGITSTFNAGGGSFSVDTPDPSRESAILDAGVDADLNRTVSVFAEYLVQAGQDNYFGQSVQAGIKIGF